MEMINRKSTRISRLLRWCAGATALLTIAGSISMPAHASDENPSEVLLGVFWSSEADMTDTLYVSFNGVDFKKIGTAYQDSAPNSVEDSRITESPSLSPRPDRPGEATWDVNALHDPGLIYKDGWFWSMSGWDMYIDGEKRFIPMLGASKDLVNWSFPNSGSAENIRVSGTLPFGKDGQRNNTNWNSVAPDFMVDDDGTVWIVVSMGYYAQWNGDNSVNDKMSPYLIKATGLTPGSDNPDNRDDKGKQPIVTYSDAVPINLPDDCDDRIDGSLYKENGKYYLSIKSNGVTNEIWTIDDLNDCQDPSKWTKVYSEVITGFEGPCLVKYAGDYYFYTDKLADYPPDNHDGTTGTFMTRTNGLGEAWTENVRITTTDINGNHIENRHGTVMCVSDPEAVSVVMDRYRAAGYTYDPAVDCPQELNMNGWYRADFKEYWYENGVKQGTEGRGKEIYDPSSDAWYWLDAIQGGIKAVSKDVYQESEAGQWADRPDGTGKWVRYDENGHMIKGWQTTWQGRYYFDPVYGTMAKGEGWIDGRLCYFDSASGIGADRKWVSLNGGEYWYENAVRQGYRSEDPSYRGKEVYDPSSDAWYWLDNVDAGKKAVSKDVYQESAAGQWAENPDGTGKWVRYDANGHMVKGWQTTENGTYYFDLNYGTMAKGNVWIDGKQYSFDPATGVLQNG